MLRRAALVLLAVAAVAIGGWYFWLSREKPVRSGIGETTTTAAPPVKVVPSPVEAHSALDSQSAEHPSLPSGISPAPVSPLALAFESSSNLAQLVLELSPRAAAGDAQAARVIAQALDECATLSVRRGGTEGLDKFAEAMPPNRRNVALAHVAQYRERCAELAKAEKMTPERLREASHAGSLGNDLVDQAQRVVESSTTMSEAEVKDTLRRIVQSRDARAIAIMADAMGQNPDDREIFGTKAGTHIYAMAWKLVACDLGMSCGPSSALVRQGCVVYARCIPGDYREIVRFYLLTPSDYELTLGVEREILQDIADGGIDRLFP